MSKLVSKLVPGCTYKTPLIAANILKEVALPTRLGKMAIWAAAWPGGGTVPTQQGTRRDEIFDETETETQKLLHSEVQI